MFANLLDQIAVATTATVPLTSWVTSQSVAGEWSSVDFNASPGQFTAGCDGVYAVKATVQILNNATSQPPPSPSYNPLNALGPSETITAQIFIRTTDSVNHPSAALAVSSTYQSIVYFPVLTSFPAYYVNNGPYSYSLVIGADLQLLKGDILTLAVINTSTTVPVFVQSPDTIWSVHRVK